MSNIILLSDKIFNFNKDKDGAFIGFPNNSELVYDVIELCRKHNIQWKYEGGNLNE